MNEREELDALRRLAELEAKAGAAPTRAPQAPDWGGDAEFFSGFAGNLGDEAKSAGIAARKLYEAWQNGWRPADAGAFVDAFKGQYEQAVGGVRADQKAYQKAEPVGAMASNIAGSVGSALAIPGGGGLGANIAKNAAAGAGYGFGAGEGIADSLGTAAAGGALAGAIPLAFRGASRLVSPKASTDPAVAQMQAAGIPMTVGQVLGGGVRATEQKLTSVPVLGDSIRSAYGRSHEAFNRAVANKVLEPLGVAVPENVAVGHDLVKFTGDQISKVYDDILPNAQLTADGAFAGAVKRIFDDLGTTSPAMAGRFADLMHGKVGIRFDQAGQMSGEGWKMSQGEIARLGRQYGGSVDVDQQELGRALSAASQAMRDWLARANPQHAEALRAADAAWKRLTIYERSAAMLGAKDGVISPAQFKNAVKASDQSVRDRSMARGTATMQEFADAADKTLSVNVPDSGTPGRLFTSLALLGAGAVEPSVLGATLAGAGSYLPPVQSRLVSLLTKRPAGAQQLAGRLDGLGNPAASVGVSDALVRALLGGP